MAHVQQKPEHATSKKDFVVVQADKASHQQVTSPSQNEESRIKTVSPQSSDRSEGFEIAGLPWQFAFVMAVIAAGLLGMILKLAGLIDVQ